MNLADDLDTLVHSLPDDWTRALVMVRYERTLQPFRSGFRDDDPSPAAQLIRPVLGGNTPLYLTRGQEMTMVSAMRAVEHAGYKGQVTLREVFVAGTEECAHWDRPEGMHRARPEESPSGGYVLRAA